MPFLEVRELSVSFTTDQGTLNVLDAVEFDVDAGKTVGIVGESGCGKSITALSIMGLLPRPAGSLDRGRISLNGQNIANKSGADLRTLRGDSMAMIFQEPMTALNPVHRIGKQLTEALSLHRPEMNTEKKLQRAVELLEEVGISSATQRIKDYPHQLSGGMRQRVMIAMALACNPKLLIADEPTTALDVTIQAQILELLAKLQKQNGMAMLFITHDLGVIAQICDSVVVMYAGRIVEKASVHSLFENPRHPYTQALLASIPLLSGEPKVPLNTIAGSVPELAHMPDGCRFSNRCEFRKPQCDQQRPPLQSVTSQHQVACLRWQEL